MFQTILSFLSSVLSFALHLNFTGSFPRALKPQEESELLERMKKGDEEAKNKLIEHNLRLVAHVIKKYYSNYSDQEDLISIGTIGLIKAVNSFKSDNGTRLATYAARCIENEILMHFRSMKKNANVISIDEPIETDKSGNPLTLMDIICSDDNLIDDIDKILKKEKLYKFVGQIEDEREKEIIIRRYGLYNTEIKTQKEIAKMLGISRSYVSRIEKKVLDELREKFEETQKK